MSKYLRLAALLWVALWAGVARAQTAASPLDDVLHDMQGAPWQAVEMTAREQAASNGPRFRSAPSQVPFYKSFEGTFTPQDALTRLAIFSDDGCDVSIDGLKVHAQKDRPQNMTVQSQALHKLNFALQAGRAYRVRVDFSNVIYLGEGDMDGVTLFAYTGEAVTPTPTRVAEPTATPVATPTATPQQESWGRLRIFKNNDGELGEEVGVAQSGVAASSVTVRNQAGEAEAETETTGPSVGGDIWLTFEFKLAKGERLWTDIESAEWYATDLSTTHTTMTKQPVSVCLDDENRSTYVWRNGSWVLYSNWSPYYLDEDTLVRFESLCNTRTLHNGPHGFKCYERALKGK